jgi:hypothetical protein
VTPWWIPLLITDIVSRRARPPDRHLSTARRRSAAAIPVVWLVVIETVLDLAYGTVVGIRHHATDTAHDLTWVILNFYVPVLWVSTVLVAWQMVTRRNELLGGRNLEPAGTTKRRNN